MHPAAARLLLSAAYPVLAHLASEAHSPRLAALALMDIVLILLVGPLLRRHPAAWGFTLAMAALLWQVRDASVLPMLLLAPPVIVMALLSWWFARTLAPGDRPLITRLMMALEGYGPGQVPPALLAYTRRLTAVWAVLLGVLAVANAVLGVYAVPDGLLARLGHPPAFPVPQAAWSWFAHVLNYGIVGGVFVVEYRVRVRRFPDRPYRNLPDFLRRLGTLDPAIWRAAMRPVRPDA
jgi:uncharacterized membrane protein